MPIKSICGLLEDRWERSVFRLQAMNLLGLPMRLRKKLGSLFSVARFKLIVTVNAYYSLSLIKGTAVFWNTGGKGLSSGFTQRIY
jgi:hypothetical protein